MWAKYREAAASQPPHKVPDKGADFKEKLHQKIILTLNKSVAITPSPRIVSIDRELHHEMVCLYAARHVSVVGVRGADDATRRAKAGIPYDFELARGRPLAPGTVVVVVTPGHGVHTLARRRREVSRLTAPTISTRVFATSHHRPRRSIHGLAKDTDGAPGYWHFRDENRAAVARDGLVNSL